MLELQGAPTELSTAATDLLLGVGCLLAAWRLGGGGTSFRRGTWRTVFVLLGAASLLGAAAHGLMLPAWLVRTIWYPLYLALGLAVALVLVAALYDAFGEPTARRWRLLLLVLGLVAIALTVVLDGAFIVFVLYEAFVTLTSLGLYARLAGNDALPGATSITLGLLLNLVAAGVQASDLEIELIFEFDHNGLFHIVMMPALLLIYHGVTRGPR